MKFHNLLIFIILLTPLNVSAGNITVEKLPGGSIKTDLGFNIYVNKDSSLERTWYIANDETSPVKLVSAGIKTGYSKRNFKYQGVGIVKISSNLAAVDIRFLLYDVFGAHIKTLSSTEVRDFKNGSTLSINDWGTWRAWDNDVLVYLTSFAFVAQARRSDGSIWRYDAESIQRQLEKVQLSITKGIFEPKKEK